MLYDLPDFDLESAYLSFADDSADALTGGGEVSFTEPLVYAKQVTRRETIASLKQENLAALVPTLPPPDTDLYIIGNGEGAETAKGVIESGRFDFGSFIPHLVTLLGGRDCILYCSTWVMNLSHVEMLLRMIDARQLAECHILTDPFFKRRHTRSIATRLEDGLQERRGIARTRILFFKNHAKILLVSDATRGRFVSVCGSSNLTAVQRVENYVLTTSQTVYEFYRDRFFEVMYRQAGIA